MEIQLETGTDVLAIFIAKFAVLCRKGNKNTLTDFDSYLIKNGQKLIVTTMKFRLFRSQDHRFSLSTVLSLELLCGDFLKTLIWYRIITVTYNNMKYVKIMNHVCGEFQSKKSVNYLRIPTSSKEDVETLLVHSQLR